MLSLEYSAGQGLTSANWAVTCVDSDMPAQPPFKLRNSKWCSGSSLRVIEYSKDKHRFWSDCAYAQVDMSLCWSHIPHWRKSRVTAQVKMTFISQSEVKGPAFVKKMKSHISFAFLSTYKKVIGVWNLKWVQGSQVIQYHYACEYTIFETYVLCNTYIPICHCCLYLTN